MVCGEVNRWTVSVDLDISFPNGTNKLQRHACKLSSWGVRVGNSARELAFQEQSCRNLPATFHTSLICSFMTKPILRHFQLLKFSSVLDTESTQASQNCMFSPPKGQSYKLDISDFLLHTQYHILFTKPKPLVREASMTLACKAILIILLELTTIP